MGRIVDNPVKEFKSKPEKWHDVVAVVVDGRLWQFKGWPDLIDGDNPVNIFSKMKGFYLNYDGDKIPENVGKWDIHKLQINRHNRHLDDKARREFWDRLDQFMYLHRPDML